MARLGLRAIVVPMAVREKLDQEDPKELLVGMELLDPLKALKVKRESLETREKWVSAL